ncbi:SGNH/GDSL hydrolase family protein [Marinifilum fragile]|uniref:SGNH/GDSL hydrolase family protein n=1 Tax=Marinifilum fragile TaxID=570161 RepID=UPI002AA8DEB9|nr:SGNH/GDSL hydrolase family protein [Marinifilum fragile]
MKNTYYLLIVLYVIFAGCSKQQSLFVPFSNSEIKYSGRIDTASVDHAELYWSGSSIKINFEGESLSALMKDEKGDNYYNIIIDKDSIVLFRPDTIKGYHELVTNLSPGKHIIELFKRTEWDRGTTDFYGFKIDGKAKLLPNADVAKRKIEFYGNSITAGYAVEDTSGKDSPDSTFTNNYLSYAAITARHFDADYHCICKSGIGITISWFPFEMPDIYDRLNPADSTSKWNFSLYAPDVVVVNLFQNDSWLVNMPKRDEFKKNFGKNSPSEEYLIHAYQQFVTGIRNHYPNAEIICMLGNMDATKEGSQWPEYIKKAVVGLKDDKIYTHFVPFKETRGHPSVKEQEEMANSLIKFIDENINW